MNSNQKNVYDVIAEAVSLATPAEKIEVDQTPTFLKEPISVADFAAGVAAALGASAAELGQARGLPAYSLNKPGVSGDGMTRTSPTPVI